LDSLLRLYNLRVYWQRRRDPETSANLDLLLTDAFLKLSRHLLVGRVQPEIRRDGWHVSPESVDRAEYLEGTLAGRHDVRERLHALTPTAPEYGKMKYWLEVYRGLAADGGWGTVPDGPALGPGSKGSRVAALCARLRAGGEWRGSACGEAFTPALGRAVERFQAAHGLDTDGAVGTRTLAALNVSVEDRIRQIELNLDCWRWLPRDLGRRHVRVNIADYRLGAFERDRQAFSMRVVVGRKEDSTPVFSDRIVSVELNPAWNVPPSIAAEEMLPELRKDPRYLADHDMELLTGWSDTARTLRADSIDWEAISQEDFPFMIRQRNGDASALGRLKFVLTNPFNIYLHDTPAKRYFEKDKRALSHGCVRVADPLKLAQWVLGPDTAWTRKRLSEAIGKGDERYLPVPGKGVPVHLLYWTCFVDKEGGLQFRPDVYHWNGRMKAAMAGDAGHP
jgi:murein L,D-transpeptidase YcbB/YkuD